MYSQLITLNIRLFTAYLNLIKKTITSHMMINNELQLHMNLMHFSSKWISSILARWYDSLLDLRCKSLSNEQITQKATNNT